MGWEFLAFLALVLWCAPLILALIVLGQSKRLRAELEARVEQLERQLLARPTPSEPDPLSAHPVLPPLQDSADLPAQSDTPSTPVVTPSSDPAPIADPFQTPPPAILQQHRPAAAPISPLPTPSVPPLEPDEQSISVVTSVGQSIKSWFTGGNTIVRVGILLLLIGVVFLLRLASEYFQTPIELRLAGVALGGLALIGVGLRLSGTRRGYGLSLQGGGLAILYLTLFAAFRLYSVLPSQLTFALLAILAAISAIFAVKQDALPLALLAFGGAFLAPILTSTGQGNVVALFSYYFLLNLAVAWIAHQRTWKMLNLLGAAVTFGLAGLWGWQRFDASVRWPLEGLLIAHLALYIFIVVRYSQQLIRAQDADPTQHHRVPVVDSGLLFGVPMLGFGLQAGLLHDVPYALAVSSAVLAAVYLAVGRYLLAQGRAMRLLTEGVLALGIAFSALVLPLALDAKWTAAGWAVQGAALVWLGQRQARRWLVYFGLLLELASLLVLAWGGLFHAPTWSVLALTVLVCSLWVSAMFVRHHAWQDAMRRLPPQISPLVLAVTLFSTVVWLQQVWFAIPQLGFWQNQADVIHVMWDVMLMMGVSLWLASRLGWTELQTALRLGSPLLGVLVFAAAGTSAFDGRVLRLAMLALGVVAVTAWGALLLKQLAMQPNRSTRVDQALWVLALIILLSIVPDEFAPWLQPLTPVLLPAALWLGLAMWQTPPAWLDTARIRSDIGLLVMVLFGLWVLAVNGQASGQLWGLPYIPLLNPLDLTLGLVGLSAWAWLQATPTTAERQRWLWAAAGLAAFWTLTGMVIRTLHQWAGTPLWTSGAWDNDTVQTSLTIVWTLVALLLTVLASRHALRMVWLAGIALLGIVVLKLMLVDLSNVGAIARVVSFMGAGGLMLLIGYIAPLPPAIANTQDDRHAQDDADDQR